METVKTSFLLFYIKKWLGLGVGAGLGAQKCLTYINKMTVLFKLKTTHPHICNNDSIYFLIINNTYICPSSFKGSH